MFRYRNPLIAAGCFLLLAALLAAATPSVGAPRAGVFANESGESMSVSLTGAIDPTNPFFQSLGVNGRACVHCHQPAEGWSITPAGVRARFEATDGLDPIFRPNDGSNCPSPSRMQRSAPAPSIVTPRGILSGKTSPVRDGA